jgi:hypothetical protein
MRETLTSIQLQPYFPFWRGHLITEAFTDLLFGLYRECARLDGRQFLVTYFKQEYDSDGLTEDIDLLEGFDTFEAAGTFVTNTVSRLLPEQIEQQSDDFIRWYLVDRGAMNHPPAPVPSSTIHPVYKENFKIADQNYYCRIYNHFEVLEISTPSVINDALLVYLNCEMELKDYFIKKGKAARQEMEGGAGK